MRRFAFCVCMFLALEAVAAAESIVSIANAPDGRYFTDASGYRLNDGSLVFVGTFEDETALTMALPVEVLAEVAGWRAFGDTATINIFGNTGKLGGNVVNDSPDAPSFGGKNLFLWVFNAPTIAGVTQYGIFTARGGDTPWVFAQGGVLSQTEIDIDNPTLIALVGSVNGNQLLLTQIIPEPAAYAVLLGLGALGAVGLRRRLKHRTAA